MMDFITHGLWHCVMGVDKDSGVIAVGKDSSHDTWLSLISSNDM